VILQALLLFLLDFIAFGLFDRWISFFLLALLVYIFTYEKSRTFNKWVVFLLFLLQNFIITGRLGLATIYLIPMIILGPRLSNIFRPGSVLPGLIGILFCLISHFIVVNNLFVPQI